MNILRKATIYSLQILTIITLLCSNALATDCIALFKKYIQIQTEGIEQRFKTLSQVPNGEAKAFIGILVETESGKRVLGIAQPLGLGHKGLFREVEAKQGEKVVKVLWAGELLASKPPENSQVKITRANETAGILSREEIAIEILSHSRVENLESILRQSFPELISSDFRAEKFSQPDTDEHLLPHLKDLKGWRHAGNNNLTPLNAMLQMHDNEELANTFAEIFVSNTKFLSMLLKIALAQAGAEPGSMESLPTVKHLKSASESKHLQKEEYEIIHSTLAWLHTEYKGVFDLVEIQPNP